MTFKDLVGDSTGGIIGVINGIIVPALIALAFLVFIYGVFKYFFLQPSGMDSYGERGGYKQGRAFILWGLVGLVVIFSVWGLVNMLLSTLGIAP